ncbi:MAG: transporter substrate-binding domain-containing protein, partial [Fibromonadaceae bacterium]|nr:transporter substrate-binding domain-containing protein [Fibromonadaceae bacterium]
MNEIKKYTLFFVILLSAMLSSCGVESERQSHKPLGFSSFRDIPGITKEEIAAIEALQKQYQSFSYGMVIPSTEAFLKENGEIGGFSALACEWISELFGIQFVPVAVEFNDLFGAIQRGDVDFSGALRFSEEHRQTHFATDPIALRVMKSFRIKDNLPLDYIALSRPLRYGLFRGTVSVESVAAVTDHGTHEIVLVNGFDQAYEMLKSNKIDAFIVFNPVEAAFDKYEDVVMSDFLPLIFGP